MNLQAVEIKALVPALQLEISKQFYRTLGFELPWSSEDLAYVRHGEFSFLLQACSQPEFSQQFQMHLLVAEVDAWHAQVVALGIAQRFAVHVGELQDQPWGMREFVLSDPSGVSWRIAQNIPLPQ